MTEMAPSVAHRFCVGITSVLRRCVAVGVVTLCSYPALAEELVENQTNSALSAFYGFCLNEMFDLDQVSELATRFGWEVIPNEELQVFVPQIEAEVTDYSGYLALTPDEPPLPIAVFVGQSVDPDGLTYHCSIFFRDVLPDEFLTAFIADTQAIYVGGEQKAAGWVAFYAVPEFRGDFILIESQTRGRGLRATRLMPQGDE
ncbi:hypothetical protein [uncultured Roseobacter sp.]|uniref:hypothetical protein n=1 Tax=uncultured Roseobacter sp. TaxID=114847 RepID=UPI00260F4BA1|nr:hypothetical protein [uncultured Roseobacter sp.]